MPKPVLGGKQEVPTRTARGESRETFRKPGKHAGWRQVQSRNRSRGERCQIRDKTQSNFLTLRAPGIENRREPMHLVSESKPSCRKWACGRRPSHASTGQQRSTQKNPHRDAIQRPTNSHMRARYQCKIKRRYIVTGRMRKTELDGPSEVGTEEELIAQRTEIDPRNHGKDHRENRKDRRRAGVKVKDFGDDNTLQKGAISKMTSKTGWPNGQGSTNA